MTKSLLFVASLLFPCLIGPLQALPERPNVIFIIADDMAWNDCGAFGNSVIQTPNIDRLAREGLRFDQAFLTISSCSPSRSSILTGKYPHRTDAEELHWPLPGDQLTFAELLKKKGYWTAAAGKWHLGSEVRDRFDEIVDADTSGFQLPAGNQSATFKETTAGEAQSGCADWVPLMRKRPKDRPFFLWLAALDPHRPYHPNVISKSHQADEVVLPPYHPDHPKVRSDYALYYDEITRLDRYVGKVRAELKKQKVEKNTLILFFSDNGRPFPRDKITLYDSGIRTPLIAHWPEGLKNPGVCHSMVSSLDFGPTVLDLAGLPIPAEMDGRSMKPLFHDPTRAFRDHIFAEKNWHDFEDHARCARNRKFKYIRNAYPDLPNTPPADAVRSPTYEVMLEQFRNGSLNDVQKQCFNRPRPSEELYDITKDPHEINNLAGDPTMKETLEGLRAALDQWVKATGDKVPTLRTADEFDRDSGKPTSARRRPRWSKKRMVEEGLTAP